MTFPYSVQVTTLDKPYKAAWNTIAKCADKHKADVLAFGLHAEGYYSVRVLCGREVCGEFPKGGEPKSR